MNELTGVIRGKSGNGAVTTTGSQKVGHEAHSVVKKLLHGDLGHPHPKHKPELVAAGKQAEDADEFMSLDDNKGLSDF